MADRRADLLLGAALLGLLAGSAEAQVPAGAAFRVNTYTTSYQWRSAVATDAAGNFVVVWASHDQGLALQRYRASGAPVGAELVLPAFDAGSLSAAATPTGRLVVAWDQLSNVPLVRGVYAQRFNATGQPDGASFRVNADTTRDNINPSVALAADGSAVVAWEDDGGDGSAFGVLARRYDAAGAPLGSELRVNTFTTGDQYHAAAVAGADGRFTVVWDSPQTGLRSVFGQRFDASGQRDGAEFRVNTVTTTFESFPSIAMDAAGRTIVTWSSSGRRAVFAQRYDASGAPLGGEMQISDPSQDVSGGARVAAAPNGTFVAVWENDPVGPFINIKGHRFEASGASMGAEFMVASGREVQAAVAIDPAGSFVASWTKDPLSPDPVDVFARRYGGLFPSRMVVDPAAGSASDGDGVLEPCEAVEVRPAWSNFTAGALAVSGSASNFTGPAGATYTILDAAADYGTLANGATADCAAAGGDCYRVQVSCASPRPAEHWDTSFREDVAPLAQGQAPTWVLHVGDTFGDVPRASAYYRFVEAMLHRGVTGGCAPALYCPGGTTTRAAMATFVLAAREGPTYRPPSCGAPVFGDVPAADPFCPWIEELARRGVVAGCGGGNFCPSASVTREQVAVFALRTLDPTLNPPACTTPRFGDVPAASPFCRWIEELARRGAVTGCAPGLYCPAVPISREQMAVIVTAAFGLTLYGP